MLGPMTQRDHTLLDAGPSQVGHRVRGRGPDVLLVHGWPLDGDTWRHIVPHLERTLTCHVIDLPGTARSAWTDPREISIAGHARALLLAIDRLGLERVAIVAHDSGAGIARIAAAELGARCTGLVLANTEIPGHHPPLLELLLRISRLPGGRSVLPAMMRSRVIRRSPLVFGGCFSDPRFVDGEFSRIFVEPLLEDPRRLGGQLALLETFDWSALDEIARTHARITAPVRMIWGAEDRWFPLAKARPMLAQFPGGAELEVLSPGKLFVHEERPREWAAIARQFLERATATAARAA